MKSFPATCCAAALGLAAACAQAQAPVSVYGLVDMSAGRFQTAGSSKVWRAQSGNMSTSFIGFKGSEDLGGGLRARFVIEHFLRLDEGVVGRSGGDSFWSRSAYVGLQGAFGATQLGRNTTPLYVSTLLFNPFGDSFGFSPSIRHYFQGGVGVILGDSAWSNSIAYNSPALDGASINLAANLGEGGGSGGKNIGANLLYFAGPLAATVAWQNARNGVAAAPAGFDDQSAIQFGAGYSFAAAKLFAQAGRVKTTAASDTTTRLYEIGASVALGGGAVLAAYGQARSTTGGVRSTRKTLSVGYEHTLSKSSNAYAVLMNDKATALEAGNTFALGLRLGF